MSIYKGMSCFKIGLEVWCCHPYILLTREIVIYVSGLQIRWQEDCLYDFLFKSSDLGLLTAAMAITRKRSHSATRRMMPGGEQSHLSYFHKFFLEAYIVVAIDHVYQVTKMQLGT